MAPDVRLTSSQCTRKDKEERKNRCQKERAKEEKKRKEKKYIIDKL